MTDAGALSRRRLLAGAAALAGGTLVTACSRQQSMQSGDGGSADAGVLNVWGGVPADKGPQALVDAFMKKYPSIKVAYTRYVNDDQGNLKLDTALQGGTPIDVYFSYGVERLAKRVKAGLALDLTDLTRKVPDLEQFADTASPQVPLFDDKLYELPTTTGPVFVYLNQEMLDKAGVQIPDDWTADDFHEVAKELVAAGRFGSYVPPEIAVPDLGGNAAYSPDGKESNFDHPAFRREMQLHVDMIKDRSAFPEPQILAQKLDVYQQSVYLTERFGLWISSPFNLRYVSDTKKYPHTFRTTFAPYPRPVKDKSCWNPGLLSNYVMISPKSQYQAAAWTFVQYWMGEGARHMLTGGKISPTLKGTPDEITALLLGDDRDRLYDVEAFKQVFFRRDVKLQNPTITTAAEEILNIRKSLDQQALLGKLTVDEWVTKLKSEADAAIKKAR